MTDDEFWKLIETSRADDAETHAKRLTAQLAKKDVADILAFGKRWDDALTAAYTWPLWGAAYLINGGCSDDGFEYFRCWLILLGKSAYQDAVQSPDSLAMIPIEADEAECECYPAPDAYQKATRAMSRDAYYNALTLAHGPTKHQATPSGEEWDFDDSEEMEKRLPNLFANYAA